MKNLNYILDGTDVSECKDFLEWALWYTSAKNKQISEQSVGRYYITTVFTGIDARVEDKGLPLVFATKIFGNIFYEYQTRCSTYNEAEVQHQQAVQFAEYQTRLDSEWHLVEVKITDKIHSYQPKQEILAWLQERGPHNIRFWGIYFKDVEDALLFKLTF